MCNILSSYSAELRVHNDKPLEFCIRLHPAQNAKQGEISFWTAVAGIIKQEVDFVHRATHLEVVA
jgi:hypothetical protein